MNLISLSHWLDAAFTWTWTTSLYASVLILLVFTMQRILGRWLKPSWRYALGFLVLVRLLLPWTPTSSMSIFNLGARTPPTELVQSKRIVSSEAIRPESGLALTLSPETYLDQASSPALEFVPPQTVSVAEMLSVVWLIGFTGILSFTLWRHRKFSRMVKGLERVSDPTVIRVCETAKESMGVAKPIRLVKIGTLGTPAVFGFRKPCLLIPEGLSNCLDERELRLVLLHELAHIKRSDVLINWVMIGVRALHWFNPLVWLAMRQLRNDREWICDEIVMKPLNAQERRSYGNALIKLAETLSPFKLNPVLAPIIKDKSELKRRVGLIADKKQAGRISWTVSALLFISLCSFVIPRATEADTNPQNEKNPEYGETPKEPEEIVEVHSKDFKNPLKASSDQMVATRDGESAAFHSGVRIIEDMLENQAANLLEARESLDSIHAELGLLEIDSLSLLSQSFDSFQRLTARKLVEAKTLRIQSDSLIQVLRRLSKEELRKTLPTVAPDAQLKELLSKLSLVQAERALALSDYGTDNPRVVRSLSVETILVSQINARIEGILQGLEAQAKVDAAVATFLDDEIYKKKERDAEMREKYRPYFQAKRDFETEQRILETLKLRLIQEKVDAADDEIRVAPVIERNTRISVPLTRNIVGFVPRDLANPNSFDRIVVVDMNGKVCDLAQSEKIVVNIKGTKGTRFAVARISMLSNRFDFIEKVNESRRRLLDTATGVLSDKSLDDINRPGFRNVLRSELRDRFNTVLGPLIVNEVIISEYVIQ